MPCLSQLKQCLQGETLGIAIIYYGSEEHKSLKIESNIINQHVVINFFVIMHVCVGSFSRTALYVNYMYY